MNPDKLERIKLAKTKSGSRNDRHLKKYSDKFNRMFDFYLKVYRTGLITFCGVGIEVNFDVNGSDGKFGFREYDNGRFKLKTPVTKHSNILKAVILGKKGWGLWVEQWSQGISEWSFTKDEILEEFHLRNIEIPESLMLEWDKLIEKKKAKRDLDYITSKDC